MPTEKRCSHCDRWKKIENFSLNARSKDGYNGTCKQCVNAYQAEYRKENKTKEAKRNKKWQKENPRFKDGKRWPKDWDK